MSCQHLLLFHMHIFSYYFFTNALRSLPDSLLRQPSFLPCLTSMNNTSLFYLHYTPFLSHMNSRSPVMYIVPQILWMVFLCPRLYCNHATWLHSYNAVKWQCDTLQVCQVFVDFQIRPLDKDWTLDKTLKTKWFWCSVNLMVLWTST